MSEPKDRRAAIMKSALELLVTKGFDHTSTAKISEKAGVATGTLFTYFKNKEELINELYLVAKKEFLEVFPPISGETLLTEEVARYIWDRSVAWGLKNPNKMKFIVMYTSSPYITKMTQEEFGPEMELIGGMYRRSVDAGLVKDLPLDYILDATMSHIYFTVLYLIMNKCKDPERASHFFPTVWDMIKK